MPPAIEGVNSAISSTTPTVPSAEETGHLTTLTSNRCLFLEQMLVIWETQSVQERKRSPVSHQRKSVPKHKIQHATVFTQHRSPKMPGIMGPRKSHLGVRGSPGSSPPAPHLPIPAPDSAGPGPSRAFEPQRSFAKHLGPGRISGGDWRARGSAGVHGAAAGSSTSPLWTGPQRGLESGLSSFLRPGPCTRGRPQGGALTAPSRPGPRVALQDQGGPGVTFWLTRSPGPVGNLGLSPACLTVSSRPRNPTAATRVVPLLD